jgi:hypothetical protein
VERKGVRKGVSASNRLFPAGAASLTEHLFKHIRPYIQSLRASRGHSQGGVSGPGAAIEYDIDGGMAQFECGIEAGLQRSAVESVESIDDSVVPPTISLAEAEGHGTACKCGCGHTGHQEQRRQGAEEDLGQAERCTMGYPHGTLLTARRTKCRASPRRAGPDPRRQSQAS